MKTKKLIIVIVSIFLLLTMFPANALALDANDLNGDGYNDNDFNKIQIFLNQPSAVAGKTNGQAINALYDQNNPETWSNAFWNTDVPKRLYYIYWANSNLAGNADLSGFAALDQLYLYNNQISSVDISGDSILTYLDVQNNKLTSLDTSGSPNLTSLICINNNISSLNYSGCTHLFEFYCNDNSLSGALDLSAFTNLKFLDYSNNSFNSLIVSDNTFNQLYGLDNSVTIIKTDIFNEGQIFSVKGKGYISFTLDESKNEISLNAKSHSNYLFCNWTVNGEEISKSPVHYINPADPITENVVANFKPGLTLSSEDGIVYEGARFTLTPLFKDGVWEYDNTFLKADFTDPDKPVFTALRSGTTRVYYTSSDYIYEENPYNNDGKFDKMDEDNNSMKIYIDVTVKDTLLPLTGQNFIIPIVLFSIGMIAIGTVIFISKRRKNSI